MDAFRKIHAGARSTALRFRAFTLLAPVLAALCFLAACADRFAGPPATQMSARRGPTILSSGDVVRLTFRKLSELNQTQRIRSDGKINLLQIGTVKAGGKSLDALHSELASRYELKEPSDLTVSLEATFTAVYVTGAVLRPGKVGLDRPMTVLEVIMEAGGFDRESANLKNVSLTRLVNGKYVTSRLDMRKNPDAIYVQPFDMIEVPRFFH